MAIISYLKLTEPRKLRFFSGNNHPQMQRKISDTDLRFGKTEKYNTKNNAGKVSLALKEMVRERGKHEICDYTVINVAF